MTTAAEDFLMHYGVLGMRWGKRNSSPPSEDASNARAHRKKAKQEGLHTLTNKEIQELVTRMNLEGQYYKLNPSKRKKAMKLVTKFLVDEGSRRAKDYMKDKTVSEIQRALLGKPAGKHL
jgi:hypothetical protein